MLFALAIITLVFSGVLLVLGIGQRTFLAGPQEIQVSVDLPNGASFASIPAENFTVESGVPFIEVTGAEAFAATGSTRDITAWLAPTDHIVFSSDISKSETSFTEVAGVAITDDEKVSGENGTESESAAPSYDPRGSDLWVRESAEGDKGGVASTVRIPVDVDRNSSVLVSVDPSSEDQSSIMLVWEQDNRTPFAGPLIVSGIVFAVLGLVLYLLAVDHDRRGLGPRRGQKGPFWGIRNSLRGTRSSTGADTPGSAQPSPQNQGSMKRSSAQAQRRRAAVLPAIGLTSLLMLSGCSADYWPDVSGTSDSENVIDKDAQTSTAAPTPVTPEQIDRIIADVAKLSNEADDQLDPALLQSRFTADALTQRTASYTVRSSVPDYKVVPPRITDEALEYELVQSTEGWPRTVFVTVASKPGVPVEVASDDQPADEVASPSLALIMTQASPHENFQVSRVVALRGGITMPEAAPAEEGTALLADDLQSLVMAPGEVGPAYASILSGGTGVDAADLFNLEDDTLIERSGSAWALQSQATADAAEQGVRYSVTATQTDTPIVSLSTGVGGALVATTIIEERIEEPGSGRWKPTPPPSVTALSGLSGQQDRLVSVVTHQLLFFVPGKESNEKIQLLGYSSDLTGARNS